MTTSASTPRALAMVTSDLAIALVGQAATPDRVDYLELPLHPMVPSAHALGGMSELAPSRLGPSLGSSRTQHDPHAPKPSELEIVVHSISTKTELPAGVRVWNPHVALSEWELGRVLLSAWTKKFLQHLAAGGDPGRPPEVRDPALEPLCGIRQLPLVTPTLPPAQHTNAYLVGQEKLIVVDPATYEDRERTRLASVLDQLVSDHARLEAVVLTHHHADHVGSAQWLSERYRIPVWAHARTKDLLAGQVEVQRTLEEGDRIRLGVDATGRDFDLEVLFTPGHAPGHIVLVDCRPGVSAMIVGDMVAAVGTIIIDPPEGNMARYVAELERMEALRPRLLFPAHGPLIVNGPSKLRQYIDHRQRREAKVLDALEAHVGPASPEALLPSAYDDTPPGLYPLAARSCLAHLEKLVAEGRAEHDERGYSAVLG